MPAKQPPRTTWIPLQTHGQNGHQVTLTGTARAKLTDKIAQVAVNFQKPQ